VPRSEDDTLDKDIIIRAASRTRRRETWIHNMEDWTELKTRCVMCILH